MFLSYLDSLTTTKIIAISDLLFLVFSSIFLILSGSFLTIGKRINFAFSRVYSASILYSLLLFILLVINLKGIRLLHLDNSFLSANFNYDFLVSKFINLLCIFSIIFFLILYSYISKKYLRTTFEYPVIIQISLIGMLLLLYTSDLFVWFLAIELQSFCFYALAAYRTNRSYLQTEAGLKYFLFGSIASSLYLFGISIIYVQFGTVQWDSLAALSYFPIDNQYIFHISLLFIFISLFFKLGIAPFHFWLPVVYTYSSSIITYLFILLPKIPLFYLLYKFAPLSYSYIIYLPLLLSLIIGTLFAFRSTNLKTFLAYSAIANSAFFLAPILYQSIISFYAFIFYLFSYNILITIAFIPILFLRRSDYSFAFTNLRDLIILKKSNPVIACFYACMVISMSGVPPLLGFFSKLFILISALSFSAYFTVALLLAFSILSAFYYLRLVKILYFSFYLKYASLSSIPFIPAIILTVFSAVNIFFIAYPMYFIVILNLL
jgi:NADH-quinone oxidoreductase subunit N